jgi:hypothetical protein
MGNHLNEYIGTLKKLRFSIQNGCRTLLFCPFYLKSFSEPVADMVGSPLVLVFRDGDIIQKPGLMLYVFLFFWEGGDIRMDASTDILTA